MDGSRQTFSLGQAPALTEVASQAQIRSFWRSQKGAHAITLAWARDYVWLRPCAIGQLRDRSKPEAPLFAFIIPDTQATPRSSGCQHRGETVATGQHCRGECLFLSDSAGLAPYLGDHGLAATTQCLPALTMLCICTCADLHIVALQLCAVM